MRAWLVSIGNRLFGSQPDNSHWDIFDPQNTSAVATNADPQNPPSLTLLSSDLWQYLIAKNFISIKDIAMLRATNKEIRKNIDKAISKCDGNLKKFQDTDVQQWRDNIQYESNVDYGLLIGLAILGGGLWNVAFYNQYKFFQTILATSVKTGWNYSLTAINTTQFTGLWQIHAPLVCKNFSREGFSKLGTAHYYSSSQCSSNYELDVAPLYLFNLVMHGASYYSVRKFLHYPKTNPFKKIFYGGMAVLSQVASFAVPIWFTESYANTISLTNLCCSFANTAFEYSGTFMPNLSNFTVGGPWTVVRADELINLSKNIDWLDRFGTVPEIPLIAGALVTTGLIISCGIWRAKVRQNHDAEIQRQAESIKKNI